MNSNINTKMSGCPFCRSKRLPWTDHKVEVCHELARHQCTYCKELGHTNARCPKSLMKKQREEELHARELERQKQEEARKARWESNEKVRKEVKEKQSHFKENCWAAVAAKSIPQEVVEKIAEEDAILKKREDARRLAEKERKAEEEKVRKQQAKERWERNYIYRMSNTYGLKEEFTIPCMDFEWSNKGDMTLYKGEFWYFMVEGTSNDHPIAKEMRENSNNHERFRAYLKEKYWSNWLRDSIGTTDDCYYLSELRIQQEEWEEENYWQRQDRIKYLEKEIEEELEAKEQEKRDMEAKLNNKEISLREYLEWQWERKEEEWEEEDNYHADGLAIWSAQENERIKEAKERREWEERNKQRNEKSKK